MGLIPLPFVSNFASQWRIRREIPSQHREKIVSYRWLSDISSHQHIQNHYALLDNYSVGVFLFGLMWASKVQIDLRSIFQGVHEFLKENNNQSLSIRRRYFLDYFRNTKAFCNKTKHHLPPNKPVPRKLWNK